MKILKTLLKIIYKLIETCAVVFVLIFVCLVLGQRFTNNNLSLGGFRMFSVVSESMAPTYVVGDIIISKEVDTNKLEPGDDISYLGTEGTFKGKVITHRIVNIEDRDGKKVIQTKGINNQAADPYITPDQVYGKMIYKTRLLSKINKAIKTQEGFYLCIFIPLAIIIGSEILASSIEKYKEKHGIED